MMCRAARGTEVKPYYRNGRAYVKLMKDGKFVERRLDKLVWITFVDRTLDSADDSWELGYKDGNYKNCAVDNLYKIN